MDMRELDRQAFKALEQVCPKCGDTLHPVISDGSCVGFDCLNCEEFYCYDNSIG